jgi:hypothetical protein
MLAPGDAKWASVCTLVVQLERGLYIIAWLDAWPGCDGPFLWLASFYVFLTSGPYK